MFWCTDEFFKVPGVVDSTTDMIGTKLSEVLQPSAAQERESILQQVIDTNTPNSHYQLSADSRVMCTIMPLDEQAFGHKGIFAMMKDARMDPRTGPQKRLPVLTTPVFGILDTLSSRELEVLHHVAVGLTTHDIAEKVCRADKTIEHHVNSIHGKLNTHSRAQLVRYASERGLQFFTDEEWSTIVQGAKKMRNETIAS